MMPCSVDPIHRTRTSTAGRVVGAVYASGRRSTGASLTLSNESGKGRILQALHNRFESHFHLFDRFGKDFILFGRTFATIGLFKDAFMLAGDTAFTGRAVFRAYTLHLQSAADVTCSKDKISAYIHRS